MGCNAAGEQFEAGVMRCQNCRWWKRIDAADESHNGQAYGPFAERGKPAGDCKRFPPTAFWGYDTGTREQWQIGQSIRTWADDFCGEFQPDAIVAGAS